MITLTTLDWAPPFAQGLVRDLRVRWALEEAGLAYCVRRICPDDQSRPEHRARQPFGQVPALEEDGLVLFESGAILLHLAERSETLLPSKGAARARVWLVAALNTIEPPIQNLAEIDLFHEGESWVPARRPQVEDMVMQRLSELSAWLGKRETLEPGGFTVGDLMMTTVLQILRHTSLLSTEPALEDYVARCTERPAYKRALGDHMANFAAA